MDVHSKAQRSFNMSQIKSKNTKPEILLQRFLKDLKVPYLANANDLPGKPDIFIPNLNLVIFVHGCFWHGHNKCKYFVLPKSNTGFWRNKIEGNMKRDRISQAKIKKIGLYVCVVWECDLRNGKFLDKLLESILLSRNHQKANRVP